MRVKYLRIRNFVENHKVAIAVTSTAATCVVIHRIAIRDFNSFLMEHDLFEQFYNPES